MAELLRTTEPNQGVQLTASSVRSRFRQQVSARVRAWLLAWAGSARSEASRSQHMVIQLKRAYEPPAPDDGFRILVDRLWPRAVSKDSAQIDLWLKELAPSAELRRWFGHDPSKWAGFRMQYFRELDEHPDAVAQLRAVIRKGPVTLVYGARDQEHNDAVALKEYLESHKDGS